MFVRIAQLFEDGVALPRHRSVTAQPVHIEHLVLTEQYDTRFRRNMMYAVLRQGSTGSDVLPQLCDAVVRWIGDSSMTISGFELDEASLHCRVQSWFVQLVTDDLNG